MKSIMKNLSSKKHPRPDGFPVNSFKHWRTEEHSSHTNASWDAKMSELSTPCWKFYYLHIQARLGKKSPGHFFLLNKDALPQQNIIKLNQQHIKRIMLYITTKLGFIPRVQDCYNVQKSINAIYHSHRRKRELFTNSVDSEKNHLVKFNP